MIVDYSFIRHKNLLVNELYTEGGVYSYQKGVNWVAMLALVLGILPNVAGFFVAIEVLGKDAVPSWLSNLYNYAWFVGFGVSGLIYWLLMKKRATN